MYLVFTRMPGTSSGGVYVPCIYTHARYILWWSLRTLYLHACQVHPLVEFMYLVFTRMPGTSSGGVYVPCIYTHARYILWWSLRTLYLHACQVHPLVEFTYLVFTRMPSESYRRRIRSLLLYLCFLVISSANYLPCMLVLHELSRPRSISDFCCYLTLSLSLSLFLFLFCFSFVVFVVVAVVFFSS